MLPSKEDAEMEVKLAETIIDATKNIQKLHQANDVMSSMLARISTLVNEENISSSTMVECIRDLLKWYDMYQAGVLNADLVGTKLSEKSK